MKKQIFNHIISLASVHIGIDLSLVFQGAEILRYYLQTHFKKQNDENN